MTKCQEQLLITLLLVVVLFCAGQVDEFFSMIESKKSIREIEQHLRTYETFDINVQKSPQLWTPLMMAASNGHVECVKLLLHYQADPNVEEGDGFTALLFAAHHGHAEAVNVLLEKGANIYHASLNGETAHSLATPAVRPLIEEKIAAMESTLAGGDFLELCRIAALEEEEGALSRVEDMVNQRGRFIVNGERNKQGWSCLTFAVAVGGGGSGNRAGGSEDFIDFLLSRGANPNLEENDGWSPLMFATSGKCVVCVELLLDYSGAILGDKDNFSRLINMAENHGEIISMLAGAGLSQHLEGRRVTPGAGFVMDAGAIMTYVRAGANPNTPNSQGVTALMLLAQTGELHAVRDLLADGANPNWQENDGWTSAMFAVHDDHVKTLQLIIDHPDCDLRIKNKHGDPVLDIARALGRHEMALMIELRLKEVKSYVGGSEKETEKSNKPRANGEEQNGIFKFFGF